MTQLPEEHENLLVNSTLSLHQQIAKLLAVRAVLPVIDDSLIVDEYLTEAAANALTIRPGYDRPILCTRVIAVIPTAGTAGLLQLGTRSIPIPGGVTNLNVQIVLLPVDTLSLTYTGTAGPMYLEIMGNSLRGQDWRVL